MKKLISVILIVTGLLLIFYFGFVFFVFNSSNNPFISFVIAPDGIIFSIGFIFLGLILMALGIYLFLKMRQKSNDANAL